MLAAAALLAVVCALPPAASAQTNTNTMGSTGFGVRKAQVCTNLVLVATSNTVYNSISYPVFRGRGMAFFYGTTLPQYGALVTQNVILDLSPDGTNWSTNGITIPFVAPLTNAAGARQLLYTNILADRFDNAKAWRFSYATGGAASSTNDLTAEVIP